MIFQIGAVNPKTKSRSLNKRKKKPYTIGSQRKLSFTITAQLDPSLSVAAQHARIDFRDGVAVVTDLGSPGGTFVNNQRITQVQLENLFII